MKAGVLETDVLGGGLTLVEVAAIMSDAANMSEAT